MVQHVHNNNNNNNASDGIKASEAVAFEKNCKSEHVQVHNTQNLYNATIPKDEVM